MLALYLPLTFVTTVKSFLSGSIGISNNLVLLISTADLNTFFLAAYPKNATSAKSPVPVPSATL